MIIDAHYEHPRLANVCDSASGWSIDRDFCLALADGKNLKILDVGCGTGLLCDRFASQGHSVTGLDPAAEMLKIASRKPHGAMIRWVQVAAQAFLSEERFDLILMTGHAFQVLHNDDDLMAVFRMMRDHLSANGRIVFESRNPQLDWSSRWEFDRVVRLDQGSSVRIQRRILEAHRDFLEFEILYHLADETLRSKSKLRFWSCEEIESGLDAAGLRIKNLFGDWDGTSFRHDSSEEMIFEAVAKNGDFLGRK